MSVKNYIELHRQVTKHGIFAIKDDLNLALARPDIEPGIYYLAGNLAYAEQNFKSAIDLYTKALNKGNRDASIFRNRGIAHHHLGNFDNAEHDLLYAIKLNPKYYNAISDLAKLYFESGKYKLAHMTIDNGLSRSRNDYTMNTVKGNFLFREGKFVSALTFFQLAHMNTLERSKSLFNVISCLMKLNRVTSVVQYADSETTKDWKIRVLFARAYMLASQSVKAITILRETPITDENKYKLILELGKCHAAIRQYDVALTYLNQVIQFDDTAEARSERGRIHAKLQNGEKTIIDLEIARKLEPTNPIRYTDLANSFLHNNNPEKAFELYNAAINLDSTCVNAYFGITNLKGTSLSEENFATLKKLESGLPADKDKAKACFSIASHYESKSNFKGALKYFLKGNKIRDTQAADSIKTDIRNFQNLCSLKFPSQQEIGKSSKVPVFIVSLPRSGSTLLEQIISSNSEVHSLGEVEHLGQILNRITFIDNLVEPEQIKKIRNQYFDACGTNKIAENYFIDKLPRNFMFVPIILNCFPEAKIVDIRRNIKSTCWSIFTKNFSGDGHYYAYSMNKIIQYYNFYLKVMRHWQNLYPGQIITVQYENIVSDKETIIPELCDQLGLTFEESMMHPHMNSNMVRTASTLQVRKEISKKSIEDWEKYSNFMATFNFSFN